LRLARTRQKRHGFSFRGFGLETVAALSLSVVMGLTIVTWAGGDPWKSKPYQQWDAKDVLRIVNDSPWAKIVHVDAPWKRDSGASEAIGGVPVGGVRPSTGMGGMGAQPSSAPPNPGASGQNSQIPQAAFLVRWVSSRTIREALLRSSVLSGKTKEEDAEKELAVPTDTYQVFVAGPDMKPFAVIEEDELKRGTFLQTKKTKQRISPSSIQIERTPDGLGVQAIVFVFPRKSQTGESTIAADEKGADFNCVAGPVRIEATFDISKMDDARGRDL
jgi:hypothetical protein